MLSKNNAGSGFDFYFANMRDWSEPVSITLENCRAEGNRTSVSLTADNKHDTGVVKGRVDFVNSVFADARSRAVNVCGIPSGAVDVIFSGCVISNATPGAQTPDVALSAGTPRQGMPDSLGKRSATGARGVPTPNVPYGSPSSSQAAARYTTANTGSSPSYMEAS